MTSTARPGWYPDPAGVLGRFRWWDGSTWSDAVGLDPRAPAPDHGGSPRSGAPVGSRRPWWSGGGSPRRIVALLVGLVLFVAAGAGAGLALWGPGSPARSAAPAPSPHPPVPAGSLDTSERRAWVADASMVFPPEPYVLHRDPVRLRGAFDPMFLATADVHPRYNGQDTWSAAVALAAVDPGLTPGASLTDVGRAALGVVAERFFDGHPTTLRLGDGAARSVDGQLGIWFTGRIDYRVPRLPSRDDRLEAHVVQLPDGTVVVALSSVPARAGEDLHRLAATSLASLAVG